VRGLEIVVVIGVLVLLGDVEMPPEVVLFLFLPALLYWESLNTAARGAGEHPGVDHAIRATFATQLAPLLRGELRRAGRA
jgi:hypothetical protein